MSGWLPLTWQPTDPEPTRRRIDKIRYGVKGSLGARDSPLIYDFFGSRDVEPPPGDRNISFSGHETALCRVVGGRAVTEPAALGVLVQIERG